MAPDLSFGPGGEQWHYTRATKTYDLTRGKPDGLTIGTSQGVADTFIKLAPSLSALVIVDMQNFFLDPSCRDHPNGLAAVEPRSQSSRNAGRPASRQEPYTSPPLSPLLRLNARASPG